MATDDISPLELQAKHGDPLSIDREQQVIRQGTAARAAYVLEASIMTSINSSTQGVAGAWSPCRQTLGQHCLHKAVHDHLLTAMQGLQASVVVLDAELVSIDCEQQSVGLSNQQRVLYGALVITAGLNQVYNNDLAGMAGLAARPLTSLKGAQKLSHEVCTASICMASLLSCDWKVSWPLHSCNSHQHFSIWSNMLPLWIVSC